MSAPAVSYAPHAVSLLRPLLGAVVLLALPRAAESPLLLPIVLLACATDWLDGQLARNAGKPTRVGRVVDNLSDFVFLLCAFAYAAQCSVWSPPVWGRLIRHVPTANWLPVFALLASFGLYFVRLCRGLAAGHEPERSPRGHAAGISNYALAVAAGVQLVPGVNLGPWLLEPAMLCVVLLNASAVMENLKLMFHRHGDGPTMLA